jgi:hypothetical protein
MALFGKKSDHQLDTPLGAAVDPLAGTAIHVIPEQFYGAAVRGDARVTAPSDAMVAPAGTLPEMPAPAVLAPLPAAALPDQLPDEEPAPRRRSKWPLVLALFALLGGGGAAGAWWYLYGRTTTPIAQAPVCGNTLCEAGETTLSCAVDCRPTSACGDKVCSADETAASCATDCGPAPAACGNGACEAGETTLSCVADCPPPEPQPGADADNDGLTNVEERTIFGTDSANANTDRDSFVDLNEVLNLFDPAVPAPADLEKNPGITTFARAGFAALVPASWQVRVTPPAATVEAAPPAAGAPTTEPADQPVAPAAVPPAPAPTEWSLVAGTGETFVVRVIEKPATESLREWYLRTYSSESPASVEVLTNRRGLPYLMAPDRLRGWVDLSGTIVGVRYDLAGATTVEYKNLFAMVIMSVAKR